MANEESLLREVDEGLAEDNLWRSMRERGPFLLGGAAAIIVGVAGWQFYTSQKNAAALAASRAFYEHTTNEALSLSERVVKLESFIETAPQGYATLARFRLAALHAQSDRLRAMSTYRAIYDGTQAPLRLRHLARLRAANLALEDGRDAAIEIIGDLETDDSALGYFAREVVALAALRAGDYQTAMSMFETAASDFAAPEGVRTRAKEYGALARVGVDKSEIIWPEPPAARPSLDDFDGDLSEMLDALSAGGESVQDQDINADLGAEEVEADTASDADPLQKDDQDEGVGDAQSTEEPE